MMTREACAPEHNLDDDLQQIICSLVHVSSAQNYNGRSPTPFVLNALPPISQVAATLPETACGWCSARNAEFPQAITFALGELPHTQPLNISQINIMAHHFKIPSRVDILYTCDITATWKFYGYITFDPNTASKFRARELKSINTHFQATHVKFVLAENHINEFNLWNQVALFQVRFFTCTRSSPIASLDNKGALSATNAMSPTSTFLPQIFQRAYQLLHLLHTQKTNAAQAENYILAAKIKTKIDNISDVLKTMEICSQNMRNGASESWDSKLKQSTQHLIKLLDKSSFDPNSPIVSPHATIEKSPLSRTTSPPIPAILNSLSSENHSPNASFNTSPVRHKKQSPITTSMPNVKVKPVDSPEKPAKKNLVAHNDDQQIGQSTVLTDEQRVDYRLCIDFVGENLMGQVLAKDFKTKELGYRAISNKVKCLPHDISLSDLQVAIKGVFASLDHSLADQREKVACWAIQLWQYLANHPKLNRPCLKADDSSKHTTSHDASKPIHSNPFANATQTFFNLSAHHWPLLLNRAGDTNARVSKTARECAVYLLRNYPSALAPLTERMLLHPTAASNTVGGANFGGLHWRQLLARLQVLAASLDVLKVRRNEEVKSGLGSRRGSIFFSESANQPSSFPRAHTPDAKKVQPNLRQMGEKSQDGHKQAFTRRPVSMLINRPVDLSKNEEAGTTNAVFDLHYMKIIISDHLIHPNDKVREATADLLMKVADQVGPSLVSCCLEVVTQRTQLQSLRARLDQISRKPHHTQEPQSATAAQPADPSCNSNQTNPQVHLDKQQQPDSPPKQKSREAKHNSEPKSQTETAEQEAETLANTKAISDSAQKQQGFAKDDKNDQNVVRQSPNAVKPTPAAATNEALPLSRIPKAPIGHSNVRNLPKEPQPSGSTDTNDVSSKSADGHPDVRLAENSKMAKADPESTADKKTTDDPPLSRASRIPLNQAGVDSLLDHRLSTPGSMAQPRSRLRRLSTHGLSPAAVAASSAAKTGLETFGRASTSHSQIPTPSSTIDPHPSEDHHKIGNKARGFFKRSTSSITSPKIAEIEKLDKEKKPGLWDRIFGTHKHTHGNPKEIPPMSLAANSPSSGGLPHAPHASVSNLLNRQVPNSMPAMAASENQKTDSKLDKSASMDSMSSCKSPLSDNDWNIDMACVFCDEQNPAFTENRLDVHYWKECPMLTECVHCNTIVEVVSIRDHYRTECTGPGRPRSPVDMPAAGTCPLCGIRTGSGEHAMRKHLMSGQGCAKSARPPKTSVKYRI